MPRGKSLLYFSLDILAFARILFAKHNLSSFKFSTEVWGKDTAGQYANFELRCLQIVM